MANLEIFDDAAREEERRQEEERLMSLAIALSVSQQDDVTGEGASSLPEEQTPDLDPMLTTMQMNSEAIFKLMEAQTKDREATTSAMLKLLEHQSKVGVTVCSKLSSSHPTQYQSTRSISTNQPKKTTLCKQHNQKKQRSPNTAIKQKENLQYHQIQQ
ncbi:unnamed protein product [Meganyctiphanes norvegica]|uniref:Uncharacterized protein n=1 Tax=Meganyctiphanes norvegica TaxID=48144 RepID=A0AAV2QZR3_MEGNR